MSGFTVQVLLTMWWLVGCLWPPDDKNSEVSRAIEEVIWRSRLTGLGDFLCCITPSSIFTENKPRNTSGDAPKHSESAKPELFQKQAPDSDLFGLRSKLQFPLDRWSHTSIIWVESRSTKLAIRYTTYPIHDLALLQRRVMKSLFQSRRIPLYNSWHHLLFAVAPVRFFETFYWHLLDRVMWQGLGTSDPAKKAPPTVQN
jgi:hypothetical protein